MNKLLSLRAKYWLKHNKAQRSTVAYIDAKKIGVVFCLHKSDSATEIESFIRQLQNDKKQVEILAYFPYKIEEYTHKYDCFTPKNISFWGNFNTEQVSKFIDQPFDYLYHLDKQPSSIINGILAKSRAKCRIGSYAKDHSKYYELMVNPGKNDHIQEMHNYTSILN